MINLPPVEEACWKLHVARLTMEKRIGDRDRRAADDHRHLSSSLFFTLSLASLNINKHHQSKTSTWKVICEVYFASQSARWAC